MNIFRKILCPVDFSDCSIQAVRAAVTMARENEAKLILIHAIIPTELAFVGGFAQQFQEQGARQLDKFAAEHVPKDVSVTTEAAIGYPFELILDIRCTLNADLIVMGTHGGSGFERFALGSVTNRVLHNSDVPVLVVTRSTAIRDESETNPSHPIRRILCPVDFDVQNHDLIQLALSLANEYQSEIDFFHVVTKSDGSTWKEQHRYCLEKLESLIQPENQKSCYPGIVLKKGHPGEEISRLIEEGGIDLVVMGHHDRGKIGDILLGSVTRHVILTSHAPVLVLRSPVPGGMLLI